MKVLQVITDTDRRGAQVFATELGAAMCARGNDVTTVALSRGTQAQALDVAALGPSRYSSATIRALRRAMSEVDITIAHGSSTGPACALASAGRRPFVYRQIGDSVFWANTWRKRARVALVLRRASRVVALSEGAKQDLIDHVWAPIERIDVVPNGAPRGAFLRATPRDRDRARQRLGLADCALVVGYIGGLDPAKGVADAIGAVRRVDGAAMVISGDGPQREELEALAADSGRQVVFTGVTSAPASILRALDVFVLPSRGGDSMPATLIEAGFCGIPSISTPIGSIGDIVLDGRTGLLVPPDDIDALSFALGQLRDDPGLRLRLSRNAESHCAAHFEIEVIADRWLDVLARATA